LPPVEFDAFGVGHPAASENIEGAADGEIDLAAADLLDGLEVGQRAGAARVRDGKRATPGEETDQPGVDAPAKALDIDGVDEEFGAKRRHPPEDFGSEFEVREILPAVGHDPVAIVADPATEIEDQTPGTDESRKFGQPVPIDASLAEDPRGDDDVGRTRVEPSTGIVGIDSAAELESAGPGGQGVAGGLVVAGSQGNDMSAAEIVASVEIGKPAGGVRCLEIGADAGAAIGERAPDDLDDFAAPEINARSEHGRTLAGRGGKKKQGAAWRFLRV